MEVKVGEEEGGDGVEGTAVEAREEGAVGAVLPLPPLTLTRYRAYQYRYSYTSRPCGNSAEVPIVMRV